MTEQLDVPSGFRNIPLQILLIIGWEKGHYMEQISVTCSLLKYTQVIPHDKTYSTAEGSVMKLLWDKFQIKPIGRVAFSEEPSGIHGLIYDWSGEKKPSNAVKIWKWMKPELPHVDEKDK
jgi:hypothetical protein